ncbi:MAG: hypothetical protein AMJ43_05640 [Coxiella sp. DG_40]|nr:MAG: hypothetical protein AMJ43_05640 [Coxiella sp. DG_40]
MVIRKTNKKFLKNFVLSQQPIGWLLYAQAFHNTGLKLVEKYEQRVSTSHKFHSSVDIFNKHHMYKVAIYLLSHSIELLLKGVISGYKIDENPSGFNHGVTRIRPLHDLLFSVRFDKILGKLTRRWRIKNGKFF